MGNRGFYGFSRGKERYVPKEGVYQPEYSILLNGSNQWITTPITTVIKKFTIAVCIKPQVTSLVVPQIFGKISLNATSNADFPISLTVNPAATQAFVQIDSGNDFSHDAQLALPVITGSWNRICASYDGSNFIFIVNSQVARMTTAVSISAGSRLWSIGRQTFENGGNVNQGYFKGHITDLRFYTAGKSEQDCQRISQGEVDTEYLHVWYPFMDGSGSVLTDVAANLNGSLQNSPTWTTDVP